MGQGQAQELCSGHCPWSGQRPPACVGCRVVLSDSGRDAPHFAQHGASRPSRLSQACFLCSLQAPPGGKDTCPQGTVDIAETAQGHACSPCCVGCSHYGNRLQCPPPHSCASGSAPRSLGPARTLCCWARDSAGARCAPAQPSSPRVCVAGGPSSSGPSTSTSSLHPPQRGAAPGTWKPPAPSSPTCSWTSGKGEGVAAPGCLVNLLFLRTGLSQSSLRHTVELAVVSGCRFADAVTALSAVTWGSGSANTGRITGLARAGHPCPARGAGSTGIRGPTRALASCVVLAVLGWRGAQSSRFLGLGACVTTQPWSFEGTPSRQMDTAQHRGLPAAPSPPQGL